MLASTSVDAVPERFPYLDHGGVLAFAHRGGSSRWPENTMPSFQDSIDLGYRYLETDVHLSADDVLFAFHDHNLLARTGVNANIADLDAAEIDRLLVDEMAPIPRLADVFLTWPFARLNIDTKSDATVLPLIASIRAHGAIDRVCVGSFVDRRVKMCRQELGPALCTSMGKFEVASLWLAARGLSDTERIIAPCAQVPPRKGIDVVDTALVEVAHDLGIQVHVWTIDEPDQMRALLDIDVDGIMTDQPRILRDVLINRGVWAPEGVLR